MAGTVVPLGDLVYEDGTSDEFQSCYGPSWGRHRARTRPVAGNHEYNTPGASPYYSYFGAAAGDPAKGYYSYDIGSWHVVVLNSNCSSVGGCGAGSAQETWLRADLASNQASCTAALFHHPRFSSGAEHGNDPGMDAFWRALYGAGVELVVNGHDHDYERFAPQDPNGLADPSAGVREFVAGTGGKEHEGIGTMRANSQVIEGDTFGILRLGLHAGSYDWSFTPVAGGSFTDNGSASCH
jgi:hypothetical protein